MISSKYLSKDMLYGPLSNSIVKSKFLPQKVLKKVTGLLFLVPSICKNLVICLIHETILFILISAPMPGR